MCHSRLAKLTFQRPPDQLLYQFLTYGCLEDDHARHRGESFINQFNVEAEIISVVLSKQEKAEYSKQKPVRYDLTDPEEPRYQTSPAHDQSSRSSTIATSGIVTKCGTFHCNFSNKWVRQHQYRGMLKRHIFPPQRKLILDLLSLMLSRVYGNKTVPGM